MFKIHKISKNLLCFILMFFVAAMAMVVPVKATSSNNFLADVSFNIGELDQKFDSNVINYELTLPKGTKSVEATAVASDAKAKVSVGGTNLATGKVVVTVQAESGAKKYYTFFVKYGDVKITTAPTTTTPKVTTTTTITSKGTTSKTTASSSSTTTSVSEETPAVSSSTSSSVDSNSTSLLHLAIKGGKLNRGFDTDLYEYIALVDDVEAEYEIEYITESDKAVVNITKSKKKYVIEVMNEADKTTYVINLKDRNENAITAEDDLMSNVIRDVLIAFVLLVISILFFYQSRRLSKE